MSDKVIEIAESSQGQLLNDHRSTTLRSLCTLDDREP